MRRGQRLALRQVHGGSVGDGLAGCPENVFAQIMWRRDCETFALQPPLTMKRQLFINARTARRQQPAYPIAIFARPGHQASRDRLGPAVLQAVMRRANVRASHKRQAEMAGKRTIVSVCTQQTMGEKRLFRPHAFARRDFERRKQWRGRYAMGRQKSEGCGKRATPCGGVSRGQAKMRSRRRIRDGGRPGLRKFRKNANPDAIHFTPPAIT